MPVQSLPDSPRLEHLKNQAKALLRNVRAGDTEALDIVREFDPRALDQPAEFSLTTAQLTVARQYGFASWAKLRDYLDVVTTYSRAPEPPTGETGSEDFLRLACLNYTNDRTAHIDRAKAMLAADPSLAGPNIYTAAATGDVAACRAFLAADPAQARRSGGPFDWPPLLYLAYSRLGDNPPDRSAVETAALLLDTGADPDSGYLWRGMASPFTALTGAFGGGEQDQPPHPRAQELARLLLTAGADPNDNQALYNRMFTPANDHLELLFQFGLGTERNGVWRRRMADTYPSPVRMLQEQLRWAADHDMAARVRLLLDHGVDPDGLGYHPIYAGQTAYRLATLAGNREIAAMLAAAGADASPVDAVETFLGACQAGDRDEADRLIAADPTLVAAAIERQPAAVVKAVGSGRMEAVRLLLDLGFDVNAGERTGLHEAAWRGDVPLARLLLERGADPERRDSTHDSTPLGWAEHGGQQEMVEFLSGR